MKQIWYHGTIHAEQILREGFVLPDHTGIWGTGVYLTDSVKDALGYGNDVLEVEWDDDETLSLDYHKDIPKLFPFLSFEEEEGAPLLERHVAFLKKEAASILYADGSKNLVIYDPGLIEHIRKYQVPEPQDA